MFLPLAERMVEKMVKEEKIEAEAEVSMVWSGPNSSGVKALKDISESQEALSDTCSQSDIWLFPSDDHKPHGSFLCVTVGAALLYDPGAFGKVWRGSQCDQGSARGYKYSTLSA